MNWIAYLPFSVERALVDYVREAQAPGLSADRIYPGLSHASTDKPADPARALIKEFIQDLPEEDRAQLDNDSLPHDDETTHTPKLVISCQETSSVEGFIDGAVRMASVKVEFTCHSDDMSGAEHAAIAGRIFDLFCDPEFADLCSEASTDFTIDGRMIGNISYRLDDHFWISTLEMEMQCVGADM